ncbi:MAG: hypothetical protein AAF674_15635 [Pseudomonadota bacterium]
MKLTGRLEKLEAAEGTDTLTAVSIVGVSPSDDGPVTKGTGCIFVLGKDGRSFARSDYETDAELYDAADQLHREIHGTPLPCEPEGESE